MEDAVYELISEKLLTLKDCRRKVTSDNSAKINVLKNRLSEIGVGQNRLVELMMQENVEPDMMKLLNERASKFAEEKKDLVEKIETLESEASEVVQAVNLSKRWKCASYEERRSICNILIDQIYIAEDGTMEVVWNI